MATTSGILTDLGNRYTLRLLVPIVAGCIVLAVIQCGWGKSKMASQQLNGNQVQLAAELKDVTKNYLVEKLGETGFGGRPFCAYKVMDIERNGDDINEYVYAGCQEYYLKDGQLTKGTGLSLPVALLVRKQGSGYAVISHRIPGDGAQFSRDVEKIFPKRTHEEIYSAGLNYQAWQVEAEAAAKQYFGK